MVAIFMLDVWVKSAILLAMACIATLSMQNSSAAARHAVWCAAVVAVLALPVFALLMPAWRVLPSRSAENIAVAVPPLEPRAQPVAGEMETATIRSAALAAPKSHLPTDRRPRLETITWLAIGWCAGFAACVLRPILGGVRLKRFARTCAVVDDPRLLRELDRARVVLRVRRQVTLRSGGVSTMPMTWGISRPTIVLPHAAADWRNQKLRAVMLHEVAHVKRLDCLTHLLAQVARGVYWFNPLAWVAVWRLSVERERACDDLVLCDGMPQTDYARQLLDVSAGLRVATCQSAAMAMANPSRVEQRLREVLDERRNRAALTRKRLLVTAALTVLVAIPLACVKSRGGGSGNGGARSDGRAGRMPRAQVALSPEQLRCQQNLAVLVEAAQRYSQANRGVLPPSLGLTLNNIEEAMEGRSLPGTGPRKVVPWPTTGPAQPLAHYYLCPSDAARAKAPEKVTPEWVNENTLYRYLANNLLNAIDKYPPSTVMIHEDLNWKGHGDTVNVGFWDGSVRAMDRASAAKAIEESRARIDAAWAERAADASIQERVDQYGWTPNLNKASSNMLRIGWAVSEYAQKHDGRLPADLGQAWKEGYSDLPERSRTRVYLLPRDQNDVAWPESPTPQWINQHTSFVYLAGGANLNRLADGGQGVILFHTRLDAPLKHPKHGDVVLALFNDPHVEILPLALAKQAIAESQKVLDAARK